jgi:hypothetical protein
MLKKNGLINIDNFQFLFYGERFRNIMPLLKKYNIQDIVYLKKRIPYIDVLRQIKKSHLQLLRIIQPMISTKLFEGIPLNIPFLATIPKGEVEGIIREYSESSYIVTDQRADMVADCIIDSMEKYNNNLIKDNDVEGFLAKFSRDVTASEMQSLFETIT